MDNGFTECDRGVLCYRRFIEGDKNGLAEIVELYSDGLLFFINGYVNDISAAEDIMSDTFLALIVKKHNFKGESTFKTYLYKIARNKVIDYLRKRSRQATTEITEEMEESLSDDELSLQELVVRDERKKQLHAAMSKLNEQYRNILYLIYFENLSAEEAARVLGIKRRQAENLVFRARQSLKEILLSDGFDGNI